jgi:hypothetical protein
MAIKTFTTGEVLTASDTNTYLANSGLVYITEATATNAQPTLSIDNCFSATYENYRFVTKFAAATASFPGLLFRMRVGGVDDSTGNYQYMMNGRTSANADASTGAANQTSGYAGALTGASCFDVISPFNSSVQTLVQGQSTFYDGSAFYVRTIGNWHNVVSSFTGITFFPSASTFTTAFTVRIYGYRQA